MLRLEFVRRRSQMSQAGLGRRAHVDQSHIALLEAGRRLPSSRTLRAIARVLKWHRDPLSLLSEVGGRRRWVFATRPEAKGGSHDER
jgi:transcriptional regulator with XRE-family HTH domain